MICPMPCNSGLQPRLLQKLLQKLHLPHHILHRSCIAFESSCIRIGERRCDDVSIFGAESGQGNRTDTVLCQGCCQIDGATCGEKRSCAVSCSIDFRQLVLKLTAAVSDCFRKTCTVVACLAHFHVCKLFFEYLVAIFRNVCERFLASDEKVASCWAMSFWFGYFRRYCLHARSRFVTVFVKSVGCPAIASQNQAERGQKIGGG